ncbi:MAG: methyltransferase family protein [Bacilli bacterium]
MDVFMNLTNLILALWLIIEVVLILSSRAHSDQTQDAGTFRGIWMSIAATFLLANAVGYWGRGWGFVMPFWLGNAGLILLLCGIGFRHYAIRVLGQFFSAHVMIRGDHALVQNGPYRWLRHPAYTGAWIAFVGVGFTTRNVVEVLIFAVLPLWGLLRRIRVEERALHHRFGEDYEHYAHNTWRLIPFVY